MAKMEPKNSKFVETLFPKELANNNQKRRLRWHGIEE